ncbi:MAG: tetratricopeptide repeat protein, partial [Rubrivivax sp.]
RLILLQHYFRINDRDRALTTARQAAAALPDNTEILDALGRAQAASGDREQAIVTFQKLTSLQPESTLGPMRSAGVFLAGKQYPQAAQSFRRALELAPDLFAAQQGLVETLLADRRKGDALAYAKTLQQRPTNPVTGYLLEARVYVHQASYDKALDTYRAALVRFPTTDVATRVHATLMALKQPAEAEKFASQWLQQHPKDVGFIAYAGDSAMAREDFGIAEQNFRRLLQLHPENPRALNNVALMMLKQGKPGALDYAERANKLLDNSPELMDTLTLALAAEKRLDEAVALQQRALALAPADNQLRLTLAKLYLQSGKKERARSELETLAKVGAAFTQQAEVDQLMKRL